MGWVNLDSKKTPRHLRGVLGPGFDLEFTDLTQIPSPRLAW